MEIIAKLTNELRETHQKLEQMWKENTELQKEKGEMNSQIVYLEEFSKKLIEKNYKMKDEDEYRKEEHEWEKMLREKAKMREGKVIMEDEILELKKNVTKLNEGNKKMKMDVSRIAEMERTIRKMNEQIKEIAILTKRLDKLEFAIKLDSTDSGPKLNIAEKGFVVKHLGPYAGWNSVRAVLPIPSFNLLTKNRAITYYYNEVEILINDPIFSFWHSGNILIGFCDKNFLLEDNELGYGNNSIAILQGIELEFENNKISVKSRMRIDDGNWIGFANGNGRFYRQGDIVGVGIIHSPANLTIECFVTWNGELLGKAKLPRKFANVQLFPAFSLSQADQSIRVNFGKEEWRFKEFHKLLQ